MNIVELAQGSAEWHQHRAEHWNASDASVMMGCSPHASRLDLMHAMHTGIGKEFSDYVQKFVLDKGHEDEALARPIAEEIIDEDLFPCVGADGIYSASFDGLTMDWSTSWEHKRLNDELRAAFDAIDAGTPVQEALPRHNRIQLESQLKVSNGNRALFMASSFDRGGQLIAQRHCWYTPDLQLRAQIVAGWDQFKRDLAAYVPAESKAVVVGRSPETMPRLKIEARGMVTASNLDEYREAALDLLKSINRDLQTDEDFADAAETVKWCKATEDGLSDAKARVLAQMEDVDAVCRTIDDLSAETRRIRLDLDKLVTREKESRKAELVKAGVDSVREHYDSINKTLGDHSLSVPSSLTAEVGGSIRGLKTLSSMVGKIDAAAAEAKIAASQTADSVRANIAIIAEHPEHRSLIPDAVTLCAIKSSDDLRNLIAARISQHDADQKALCEAEEAKQRKADEDARKQPESTQAVAQAEPAQPEPRTAEQTRPASVGDSDEVARRRKINQEARDSIASYGNISEAQATEIVKAIAAGMVPHVTINIDSPSRTVRPDC